MAKITTVGIDLAKSVFSVRGVDAADEVMVRKTVNRSKSVKMIASRAVFSENLCETNLAKQAAAAHAVYGPDARRPVEFTGGAWRPAGGVAIEAPGHSHSSTQARQC